MAQYFNDFTQYPLATKIDTGAYDFTVLAGQTNYTFEVVEDARGASGRVLRHTRAANTGFTWWHWTAVPAASSGEMYVESIAGLSGGTNEGARTAIPRLFCNANVGLNQGYYASDLIGGSANVTPNIRRVDTPTASGASGTFYAFQTNRKRSHLLKWTDLGTSVALKYKTWWADEAEPAGWTVETTNGSVGSAPYWGSGIVGFGRYESGNIEGRVAFIGVGTGADSAPRVPLSGDTTAPTLTSPTASATGATTASGSVSTNEANGTLYWLASGNASESVATVKAGSSQAVTATLEQPVTVTGLTASTSYYLHFVHRDAAGNDSAVATSGQFTTNAAGDATPPTLTGSVTFTSVTQTSYTAQWPAGSDNMAVTGYEYQIGSTAGAWTGAGNNLSAAITGRTAGTTETVYVRAYDAAGLRSTPAISGSVTLASALAAGITVTEPLKNNTGTLLANLSGVGVAVLSASDFTYGLTTNASGILSTISGAGITAGQQYHVAIKLADGGVGITGPITAS